ncbi:MAG: PHP domain-containing protein [Fibrobacter sp.]|nr:PHP domain-containing protein [Fibrobacter sp.]
MNRNATAPKLYADLHLHTHHSDGALSVQELIDLCSKKNLHCISITDHDTLDAYKTAKKIADKAQIEIIPGIEISSIWEGRDIHILGYFIDPTNLALNLELEKFTIYRVDRVKAILQKLKTLGIELSYEKVLAKSQGKIVGRPHIALLLVSEEYCSSFNEAFDKYIGDGKPAYVKKNGLNPEQTIRLIENAGGIAVLAHPYKSGITETFIHQLVQWGIKGIETYTPSQKKTVARKYRQIAKHFKLIGSGGSDFHAQGLTHSPGYMKMPYSVVQRLKECHEHSRIERF